MVDTDIKISYKYAKNSYYPADIYLLKVNNGNTRTKVRNMFKVNNKDTKTAPMALTLNM